jgi:CubicO group peptidase (beta-lactamase class C family)
MPRTFRFAALAVTLTALLSCTASSPSRPSAVSPVSLAAGSAFPGAEWEQIADPRSVGWTTSALDTVRFELSKLPTTGFMAVVGGRVLMSYGDVTTVSYLASARKSVLSMMMGNYVQRGVIDLNKSLAQLGMDDIGGLTDQEKEATVKDLLTARSGVYHPASNSGDDLASAPPRGSQKHGTYMLYSNWDFNALGGAFERMTGRDIYDALESDLAKPLGMRDFDRATHRKTGDSTKSRYLAYHMNLSTRDMARIGLLMLRRGNWNGTQIVPATWVDESTRPFTRVTEMNPPRRREGPFGYGYLWWVWDGPHATGAYEGAYTALGAVGQQIAVVPKLDLVVIHKTRPGQRDSTGRERTVSHDKFREVLDLLVRGRAPR